MIWLGHGNYLFQNLEQPVLEPPVLEPEILEPEILEPEIPKAPDVDS